MFSYPARVFEVNTLISCHTFLQFPKCISFWHHTFMNYFNSIFCVCYEYNDFSSYHNQILELKYYICTFIEIIRIIFVNHYMYYIIHMEIVIIYFCKYNGIINVTKENQDKMLNKSFYISKHAMGLFIIRFLLEPELFKI